MDQLRTDISVSLGAGRSVIIDYQYPRAALNKEYSKASFWNIRRI